MNLKFQLWIICEFMKNIENTMNIDSTNEKKCNIYCTFDDNGEDFQDIMERIITNMILSDNKTA